MIWSSNHSQHQLQQWKWSSRVFILTWTYTPHYNTKLPSLSGSNPTLAAAQSHAPDRLPWTPPKQGCLQAYDGAFPKRVEDTQAKPLAHQSPPCRINGDLLPEPLLPAAAALWHVKKRSRKVSHNLGFIDRRKHMGWALHSVFCLRMGERMGQGMKHAMLCLLCLQCFWFRVAEKGSDRMSPKVL